MTDLVREIAPQILEKVQAANRILLHCHPSPDGDSVGGALAMMQVLEGMGKSVTLIKGDSPKLEAVSFLPGFERIVEKNWFEIDQAEFDLFIIQDSADFGLISRLGEIEFAPELETITIDHHKSNKQFAKLNLVDESYIANCQLLADVFEVWGVEITPEVARCLVFGIYTDSGGFKFAPIDWQTYAIVSKLVKLYPDFSRDFFEFENNDPADRLKALGLALSNLEFAYGGRVVFSKLDYQTCVNQGIDTTLIYKLGVANKLISVMGWDIGVSLIENQPNQVSVSFRTRDVGQFDLTLLAQAIGGGGHRAAAGADLECGIEQAVEKIIAAIPAVYPQLQ